MGVMKTALSLLFMCIASAAAGEVCRSGSTGPETPTSFLTNTIRPRLEKLGYVLGDNYPCSRVSLDRQIGATADGRPSAAYSYEWHLESGNAALTPVAITKNASSIAEIEALIKERLPRLACTPFDGHSLITAAPQEQFVNAGGVLVYTVTVVGDWHEGQLRQEQTLATITIDSCEEL